MYAMAALADDWLQRARQDRAAGSEAQVCIEVLCGYIRTPRDEGTDQGKEADARVREAITRDIAQHLQIDGHGPRWFGKTFDFTGAVFRGAHSFNGVSFNEGCKVTFYRASFVNGCRVSSGPPRLWTTFEGGFEQARSSPLADRIRLFAEGLTYNLVFHVWRSVPGRSVTIVFEPAATQSDGLMRNVRNLTRKMSAAGRG